MNACENPTCTRPTPDGRRFCDRKCQVACLNTRGYMSIRIMLTADEYHAIEDYAAEEGYPGATLAEIAKEIIWDEVIRP